MQGWLFENFKYLKMNWCSLPYVYVLVAVMSDCLRPSDCSPLSFSVPGILQARILEWVVIPFSRDSSRPRDQTRVSCIAQVKWILYCLSHWGSPINHINRLKKENHLIVLTDERENAFDKIQYPFTIKTLRNTGELPQLNENHLRTDWFLYMVTLGSMCIVFQFLSRV